ncbi:hypothetical protein V6N13_126705 [Hibiscus sabdariffa]
MPEVPTRADSEEEKLDLPDVPTKKPVAPYAAGDDADSEIASAETSLSLSTHTHTHTDTSGYTCSFVLDLGQDYLLNVLFFWISPTGVLDGPQQWAAPLSHVHIQTNPVSRHDRKPEGLTPLAPRVLHSHGSNSRPVVKLEQPQPADLTRRGC